MVTEKNRLVKLLFGLVMFVLGTVWFSGEVRASTTVIIRSGSDDYGDTKALYINPYSPGNPPTSANGNINTNMIKYDYTDTGWVDMGNPGSPVSSEWKNAFSVWRSDWWSNCGWTPTTPDDVPPAGCVGSSWPFMRRNAGDAQVISAVNGDQWSGIRHFFRKKFTLPQNIVINKATLYWTSDNKSKFWINESGVVSGQNNNAYNDGNCSGTNYGGNLESGVHYRDVTSLIKPGNNILAANLLNTTVCNSGHPMGLQFNLVIRYSPAPPPPTPTAKIKAHIEVVGLERLPSENCGYNNMYTCLHYRAVKFKNYPNAFRVSGYQNDANVTTNLRLLRQPTNATECWYGTETCTEEDDLTINQNGNILEISTTSLQSGYIPKNTGTYYIIATAANVSNANNRCTGNPHLSLPSTSAGVTYQDCSEGDIIPSKESRIKITVVEPPPVLTCTSPECVGDKYLCTDQINPSEPANFSCVNSSQVEGHQTVGAAGVTYNTVSCSFCGVPPTLTPWTPPTPTTEHTPTPSLTPTPTLFPIPSPALVSWTVNYNITCGPGKAIFMPLTVETVVDRDGAGPVAPSPNSYGTVSQPQYTQHFSSRNFNESFIVKLKAVRTGGIPVYLDVSPAPTPVYSSPSGFVQGKSYMWRRTDNSSPGGTINLTFSVPTDQQSLICGPLITPEPAVSYPFRSVSISPAPTLSPTPTQAPLPTPSPLPTVTPIPVSSPTPPPAPNLSVFLTCTTDSNGRRHVQLSFNLNNPLSGALPNLLYVVRDSNNQLHSYAINSSSQSGNIVRYVHNLANAEFDGQYPIYVHSARTTGQTPVVLSGTVNNVWCGYSPPPPGWVSSYQIP